MHMQEYKRALYDFSAAIRAESKKDNDPIKLADYYMYAGQCNQLLGQYQEALDHFDIGIAKNPDNGGLHLNRGLTNSTL